MKLIDALTWLMLALIAFMSFAPEIAFLLGW